ncbi:MAG: hypothetical protein MSA90_13070 [Faecalicatena sp.]|uniref:hypothetical protein n=1 Tax=Faecalicatena sp. TaxID=2005360 RepID=UPI002586810F|nr:hypothetical protein [Faecalicatena sp.]MCI6466386.1 hypothetical protein [Faecalicatena sp.]MCI7182357.1 hypothetical protein [Lachnospiraceae bacterium]MDY5619020.1 hypothetical protein [Lachnospiraceae bacterium]
MDKKSNSAVNVEQMAMEIHKQLKEYTDEIKEDVWQTAMNVSEKAVTKLKEKSPKLTKDYSKGWTRSTTRFGVIVHQKGKESNLTHLLEKGHQLKRGGRKIGEVAAHPHIAEVEKECIEEYVSEVERRLKG